MFPHIKWCVCSITCYQCSCVQSCSIFLFNFFFFFHFVGVCVLLGSPSSWYCWLVSLNFAFKITLIRWGFSKICYISVLKCFYVRAIFLLRASAANIIFCTTEDDTSIPTDEKVPILIAFHRHIYDTDWHYSCGTKEYKILMDQFHHVSAAFLELEKGYQEAIEEITRRMGAGMAKFICQEVCDTEQFS